MTDVRTLPVGAMFYVVNGGWNGKIVDVDGVKHLNVEETGSSYNLEKRSDEACHLEIRTEQDMAKVKEELRESLLKGERSIEERLIGADKNCDHQVEPQWDGVKCMKCGGWYIE